MAELKTKPNEQSVEAFLNSVEDEKKRQDDELLNKLGKFKTGKSCLYINKIEDVDLPTLKELITQSVSYVSKLSR